MTAQEARSFAQADPVPVLSARWGDITAETRKAVSTLEDKLRELDKVTSALASYELVVATDLGATGNAARSAFQATTADASTRPFSLPGGVAA